MQDRAPLNADPPVMDAEKSKEVDQITSGLLRSNTATKDFDNILQDGWLVFMQVTMCAFVIVLC